MIKREAQDASVARSQLPAADNRALCDSSDTKNRGLRAVENWRECINSMNAKIADGRRTALEMRRLQMAGKSAFRQICNSADDFSKRGGIRVADDRNNQSAGKRHGKANVDFLEANDLIVFDGSVEFRPFVQRRRKELDEQRVIGRRMAQFF